MGVCKHGDRQYTVTGKKGRMTYHRQQTMVLEAEFRSNRYITKRRRLELQSQIFLTDRQIKIWFQNRRMKEKKEKKRVQEEQELARTEQHDKRVQELHATLKKPYAPAVAAGTAPTGAPGANDAAYASYGDQLADYANQYPKEYKDNHFYAPAFAFPATAAFAAAQSLTGHHW